MHLDGSVKSVARSTLPLFFVMMQMTPCSAKDSSNIGSSNNHVVTLVLEPC